MSPGVQGPEQVAAPGQGGDEGCRVAVGSLQLRAALPAEPVRQ